eukprot:6213685-Pleurochrysis_carterae.AAC.1
MGPPSLGSTDFGRADFNPVGGSDEAVVATRDGHDAATSRGRQGARGLCIAAPGTNLKLCVSDCTLVSEMLKSKGVLMEPIFRCDPKADSKSKVVQTIFNFLCQPAKMYVIYYSGHGSKGEPGQTHGGRTGGALCVGCEDDDAGHLTYDELVEMWQQVRSRGQRLVLVADACYSGKLWAKLRDTPKPQQVDLGLAIQAAGNAWQAVSEKGGGPGTRHGGEEYKNGIFTGYWISRQKPAAVRWSDKEQHPQFYATWAYDSCDRTFFDVELGTAGSIMTMYSQPKKR